MDDLQKLLVFLQKPDVNFGISADLTRKAWDYSRDDFACNLRYQVLDGADDHLYVGRSKRFNAIYVEVKTPNTIDTPLITAEYFNGTDWTSLSSREDFVDDTKCFQRSGFIKWPKLDTWLEGSIGSSIPGGDSGFWIRLSSAPSMSAGVELSGINLVFADDQDLKARRQDILSFLPEDENGVAVKSFILAHVSAREEILAYFGREGMGKYNTASGRLSELNQWDFHNIDQIRKAAIAFALHFIFDNLSDTKDDLYDTRAKRYMEEAYQSLKIYLLSYDKDDDGKESVQEANTSSFEVRLTR